MQIYTIILGHFLNSNECYPHYGNISLHQQASQK